MRKRHQAQRGNRRSRLHQISAQMISLLILAIVGVWFVIWQTQGVATASGNQAPASPVYGSSVQQLPTRTATTYPPGIPAIQPHLAVASTEAGTSTPAFTSDDVAAYVISHPVFGMSTLEAVTIVQIKFMTSGALSAQLNDETIGRPDDALVCYVELRGKFSLQGIKGSMITDTAYEVFDASTGNIILTGGKVK